MGPKGMSNCAFELFEGRHSAHTPILHGILIPKQGPYVLFTDASKYGWAGVLTQPYKEIDELD